MALTGKFVDGGLDFAGFAFSTLITCYLSMQIQNLWVATPYITCCMLAVGSSRELFRPLKNLVFHPAG